MTYTWRRHPLDAEVSANKQHHTLYENRMEGRVSLGSVRLSTINHRYHYYPLPNTVLSNTQLWQIMCYVTEQNDWLRGLPDDPDNRYEP